MTEPPVPQSQPEMPASIDPVLAGFDHLVAMAGYVLLFVSVFMVGVPALAALALAYVHKSDTHLLVRSHFRFQLRIFWTAILFLALALGSVALATGLGVGWLFHLAAATPGLAGSMGHGQTGVVSAGVASLLLIAGVLLTALAILWTLGASLFGFVRLISNQPIGHPNDAA